MLLEEEAVLEGGDASCPSSEVFLEVSVFVGLSDHTLPLPTNFLLKSWFEGFSNVQLSPPRVCVCMRTGDFGAKICFHGIKARFRSLLINEGNPLVHGEAVYAGFLTPTPFPPVLFFKTICCTAVHRGVPLAQLLLKLCVCPQTHSGKCRAGISCSLECCLHRVAWNSF